ncbi:MAG: glycosyltransferase family 39 protein [Myxococcota bacterium]|nr:glycosyltransferase family 39 protein [Myxococcota bacterium]
MVDAENSGAPSSPGSPSVHGPSWLARDLEIGATLFLLALATRIFHLRQISTLDPYFLSPAVDGALYHGWAQQIANGDWVGQGAFIMGPLYPYLMGAFYSLAGPDLALFKMFQAWLGAGSCLLVWWLAREVFDRRVALLAAMAAIFYEMLIFYGGTVMVVNIQVPLVLGLTLASVKSLRSGSLPRWLGVGVLLGLSALARQATLLYLPLVATALAFALGAGENSRAAPGRRAVYLAALTLGVVLTLLPSTIRNGVVAGDFVIANSTAGANLYMGNNPGSDGRWRPPRIGRGRVDTPAAMQKAFTDVAEASMKKKLRPSEVSSYWMGQAIDFMLTEPGRWLALEGRKFLLFINANEVWNNRSIEISRPSSVLLGGSLLNLGIIMPMGLLGMALALRRWRDLFPLYAVVGVYLASAMIFFVVSRYRMPAASLLVIFAAYAGVWLFEAARDRRLAPLLGAGLALVVLVPATRLELAGPDMFMAHFNLANRYREIGNLERAAESYRVAIEINPMFDSSLNNLALVYEQMGRNDEAIGLWEKLQRRALAQGDPSLLERAERRLRSLGGQPPDSSRAPPD